MGSSPSCLRCIGSVVLWLNNDTLNEIDSPNYCVEQYVQLVGTIQVCFCWSSCGHLVCFKFFFRVRCLAWCGAARYCHLQTWRARADACLHTRRPRCERGRISSLRKREYQSCDALGSCGDGPASVGHDCQGLLRRGRMFSVPGVSTP